MILFVRKHFHKNVVRGIVLVMSLSMVGMGLFTGLANLLFYHGGYMLRVDGQGVSKGIFDMRVKGERNMIDYYKGQLGDLAPMFMGQMGLSMSPERNAYNRMVSELVLSACCQRSGIAVDVGYVARKLQDHNFLMSVLGMQLPKTLYGRDGKIQNDILKRLLMMVGISFEDFEWLLEQGVERDLAVKFIGLGTPITKKEIEESAVRVSGQRTFSIKAFSLKGYLHAARDINVTQDELKLFYDEKVSKNVYWEQEKRDGIVWKIAIKDDHKGSLEEEAKEMLKKSEKDFEEFIKKHAATKTVVKNKVYGDDKKEAQLLSMLFRLQKGEKGMYQEAGKWLVIVMPTGVTEKTKKDFDAIKKEVESDFYKERAQKAMIEDLEGSGVSDNHLKSEKTLVFTAGADMKEECKALGFEGLAVDRINNMIVEGSTLRGMTDSYGYMIALEKVEKPHVVDIKKDVEFRKQLYKKNAETIVASSVDSLIKNAKIKGDNIK